MTATASKTDAERNLTENYDRSSAQVGKNTNVAQLPPEKLAFLKKIPKLHLEQMGFGDLDFDQHEDFLSESSISDSDFELLMHDNFFDLMREIQKDIMSEKKHRSNQKMSS